MPTPTSMTVRWRSPNASLGTVRFGPKPDQLSSTAADPISRTEHEVRLEGLKPNTRYFYMTSTATGSASSLPVGRAAPYSFTTPPQVGQEKPTRIWVLGDSGTADDRARAVRDSYSSYSGSRALDLWLMLGDNAYPDGTDSQYQEAVFEVFESQLRSAPLLPTLGNHDVPESDPARQSGPYFRAFSLPARGECGGATSGTEAYYSVDYGSIHLISLNMNGRENSGLEPMISWLKRDLASAKQEWIIAFSHLPPYSAGSHDSDTEEGMVAMRQRILPILEEGAVDLVLGGHSHSYERSFLLNGHYGPSNSLSASMKLNSGDGRPDSDGAYVKRANGRGTVYVVVGSSGKLTRGALDHPAMAQSLRALGSLVIDVEGNRLEGHFLDDSAAVRDHFVLLKRGHASASR